MSGLASDLSNNMISGDACFVEEPARTIRWSTLQTIGFVGLAAATFFNMADFVGDKEGNVLDLQVVVKLAICGVCGLFGLYGALSFSRVPRVLLTFPGVLLLIIGILFLMSVPFSIDRRSSFVSSALYFTIMLASIVAMHSMGRENTLRALVVGLTAFVVASWLAFFCFPELGVYYEALPGGQFQVRMAGISHPNTLGICSGILISILFAMGMNGRMKWRWIVIPMFLALVAIVLSLSRTSMGALFLSTLIVNRRFLFRRRIFMLGLFASAALASGLFVAAMSIDFSVYFEDAMKRVSKSGDVDELTTGTGRAEIWAFAIEKTAESPFFGQGLATSKDVMVEYSGYTHNMWLNMFYSAGVFCGLCFTVLTIYLFFRTLAGRYPLIDGVVLFLLINGITENVIFSPIPGGPTIVFIIATVWPVFLSTESDEETEDSTSTEESY